MEAVRVTAETSEALPGERKTVTALFAEIKGSTDIMEDLDPPVAGGQIFLSRIYSALIQNPDRWKQTLMIVTYDESGGFFDHVPPLPIRTDAPPGANYTKPFLTTGLRMPGLIISPLVDIGSNIF